MVSYPAALLLSIIGLRTDDRKTLAAVVAAVSLCALIIAIGMSVPLC